MAPTPEPQPPLPSSEGVLFASERDAYDALCVYTLLLRDPEFLHQYVVDAWAIQHATAQTKTISLNFAMFGLYCAVEKGISGPQVQRFHMQMARTRRTWPPVPLPVGAPAITVLDVMQAAPGSPRNHRIWEFAAAVWACCRAARPMIIELAQAECDVVP